MTLIDLPVSDAMARPAAEAPPPAPSPMAAAGLSPPHAVAVCLHAGPDRLNGRLAWDAGGGWSFVAAGGRLPEDVAGRLADPATAVAVEPRVDRRAIRRRRLGPLRLGCLSVEAARGIVRLDAAIPASVVDQLPRPAEALPAMLDGRSLNRRRLPALVTAIGPYEALAEVTGPAALLVPGTLMTLTVVRPWADPFRLRSRIVAVESGAETVRVLLRMADPAAIDRAAVLAACTAPGFGIQALWTHGLKPRGLMRHLRVVPAAGAADMVTARALRRDANQFYGRRPEARDPADWADRLDGSSLLFLAYLGDKPIATARLVVNGGDRSLSELQAQVPVPDTFWEGGFVEVSRLVVHPDFRGNRIRYDLFREVERLSLSMGVRFMLFDAIPRLVPMYQAVGGKPLPLTKKHPDSDETVRVMYVDMRSILGRVNRFSAVWLAGFGSTLGRHLAIEGRGPTDAILGPKRRGVGAAVIRNMGRLLARASG
ncbi:GNAT family N-acetyltransferase [uncultured Tistrella sp.]|uniref:GNAT family N-acetyltransferase n=1 Tax=Tistrella mobilis TaxID=171437 RepID=UPI000C099671|nr:GNAT family N-acetyltransferase [uncultured Tistrella sp.]MAM73867.1 pilus assembly protein PilZ [Tistrella sp.]